MLLHYTETINPLVPLKEVIINGSLSGSTLKEYCASLIAVGHTRTPSAESQYRAPYQGKSDEHELLLENSEAVLAQLVELPSIQKAAAPTLVHPDYHKRNIFVAPEDPSVITGVIDWQSSSVEPAFEYTREYPDFISMPEHLAYEDGHEETREQKIAKNTASVCQKAYDVSMKARSPKIQAARELDRAMIRPFLYCHTSWRDSATAFRDVLIKISQRWSELGLPGTCRYRPTREELERHEDLNDQLEAALGLKDQLNAIGIRPDGWVQEDRWEGVLEIYKSFYKTWLKQLEAEDVRDYREKLSVLWPFDKPDGVVATGNGVPGIVS